MSESSVLLRGISWETYERLLDELEGPGLRLTYDQGDLEIVPTSHRHERWKTLVGRMVEAMTEELGIPIHGAGSMTFRRRDLKKGLEPDECYWIQNAARMRGKLEYDPHVDPPPDLTIESEVSRCVLDRLGYLGALGVGEVWRYEGARLIVLLRQPDGAYVESPASRCFPGLPMAAFAEHLARAGETDDTTWIRSFRAWVQRSLRVP